MQTKRKHRVMLAGVFAGWIAVVVARGYTVRAEPARHVSASPENWVAQSTTAESITGDAHFTPTWIAFGAGGRLSIRFLRDVPGSVSVLGSARERGHAVLYRVLSRSDLRLRSGNTLCGKRPTFLTILRTAPAKGADIILTIYFGRAEPGPQSSAAICASYTYFPKVP